MKRKPTREHLSFMIYDLGFYEALEKFNLNEDQAELILYGKAEKMPSRERYNEPQQKASTPTLSIHIKHLKRVAAQNYEQLFREAGAYITNKINAQSLSKYDIFSEGLESLFWNNRDFYYVSDLQAMAYIRIRLRRALRKSERNLQRFNTKVKFTARYHDPYEMPDFELNRDIEVLSLKDREIAALSSEGYSQQEIGYMIDCSQKTVCNRLKTIYQKLQSA